MTFEDFVAHVAATKAQAAEWRWGQTYMNCVWYQNPRIYRAVAGTDFDPFYSDSKIPMFLAYAYAMWNK